MQVLSLLALLLAAAVDPRVAEDVAAAAVAAGVEQLDAEEGQEGQEEEEGLSEEDAAEFMSTVDTNKDGKMSFDELIAHEKLSLQGVVEDSKAKDKDNSVLAELAWTDGIEANMRSSFESADTDKDGLLGAEETLAFLEATWDGFDDEEEDGGEAGLLEEGDAEDEHEEGEEDDEAMYEEEDDEEEPEEDSMLEQQEEEEGEDDEEEPEEDEDGIDQKA